MDSFYYGLMTGYHYTPKAKKGSLLAVRNCNEVAIKDDAEGRAYAAELQAKGWVIYDTIGKVEGNII